MTVNLQRELEKLVKLLLLTKLFALTRHLLLFLITFFFFFWQEKNYVPLCSVF